MEKKQFIIFLDIDGVINSHCAFKTIEDYQNHCQKIFNKAKELYPDRNITNEEFKKPVALNDLEWFITQAYCFNERAINNLNEFIGHLEQKYTVGIVISSAWREITDFAQMKSKLFSMHSFTKYIIDATVKSWKHWSSEEESEESKSCFNKYGFQLKTRGDEIDYWIRENKLEDNHFIILDDYDTDTPSIQTRYNISSKFPHNFVKTDNCKLLTEIDLAKAKELLKSI
jgi:hypothetical protein